MTLLPHLRTIAAQGEVLNPSLDAVAGYLAGQIDAALVWPASPLGELLEAIDGPALERVVLLVLEEVAERGTGGDRTLYSGLMTRMQTWAQAHPQRVAEKRARRLERRGRHNTRRYDRARSRAPRAGV